MVLDWRLLRTSGDILAAADAIATSRRSYAEFPTALGYALGYSASIFAQGPACWRKTLDVSGDGVSNDGFGPDLAYKNFPLEGVTVNGLTIGGDDQGLALYYQTELIRGPGAFVEEAAGFWDFERAMRRKLVRETQALAIGLLGAPVARY